MKKAIFIILLLFVVKTYAQKDHPIIGTWQLKSVVENGKTHTGMQAVFIFEKGGALKAARSLSGGVIPVGTWKCDKKNKTLVMESTMDKDFNGKAKVLQLKGNKLSYNKDGAVLNFEKAEMAKPDNTPVPTLAYTVDDFFNSDGNEKYPDDAAKIPWTIDAVYKELKNVKEMLYHIDYFKPGKGKVNAKSNSFKVKYHSDTELGVREYSLSGKDYIDIDDRIYPLNDATMGEKVFFPQEKPDYFRYVGVEKIETPAGTFDCVVFEGVGKFDTNLKYWMIKDKPGVYAKIIKAKADGNPLDYTNVYILKEIK